MSIFSHELTQRAAVLLAHARDRGVKLAFAESCTGGLIAALFTEIPGSSDVVDRGYVTYCNQAKQELLDVPEGFFTPQGPGAVSEETACMMAEGALNHSRAHIAIAVTGIAGPASDDSAKPVGLVHIALARNDGATLHQAHQFGDIGRGQVRMKTVEAALSLLENVLTS